MGSSTDGDGFLDALRIDEGFDPAGRRCVVLGAGGAARAIVHALADASALCTVPSDATTATTTESPWSPWPATLRSKLSEALGPVVVLRSVPFTFHANE